MYGDRFVNDANFAIESAKNTISQIKNTVVTDVSFPIGVRKLKINTMFSFDGFFMTLSGKDSGGKYLIMSPVVSLILPASDEDYIKKLERFCEKRKENPKILPDEKYDGIVSEKNIEIYDKFIKKQVKNHMPLCFRENVKP